MRNMDRRSDRQGNSFNNVTLSSQVCLTQIGFQKINLTLINYLAILYLTQNVILLCVYKLQEA